MERQLSTKGIARMPCVKDFNQLFLQLWRDASRREILLRPDTREEAVNLRQRLYILRKAMKDEDHPLSGAAQKAKIKIEYESGTEWIAYNNDKAMKGIASAWRLRMMPRDGGFDAMLERAGYKAPEALDPTEWERINRDILS
jgi:hypothetical protein